MHHWIINLTMFYLPDEHTDTIKDALRATFTISHRLCFVAQPFWFESKNFLFLPWFLLWFIDLSRICYSLCSQNFFNFFCTCFLVSFYCVLIDDKRLFHFVCIYLNMPHSLIVVYFEQVSCVLLRRMCVLLLLGKYKYQLGSIIWYFHLTCIPTYT